MKVKIDFVVKDSADGIHHLYVDGDLKSEGPLPTIDGKLYPPTFQGIIVDCMPE